MLDPKTIDKITDDFVAIVAIIGVTYLALNGVTELDVIGVVAGLGGYRLYQRGGISKNND